MPIYRMTSYIRTYSTYSANQRATVGDTKTSVINNDHMGWMKCDGRSIAVADYYFLWRVIGYSFGGSGDNFNLPNAAGMIPGIVGQGRDTNLSTFTYALGSKVGEYVHTLTIPEMPIHNHDVTDPGHRHTGTTDAAGWDSTNTGTFGGGANVVADDANSHTHTFTTNISTTGISIQNRGGSLHHNNVQPTLPIGNMFIFNGRVTVPSSGYPYTLTTQIL